MLPRSRNYSYNIYFLKEVTAGTLTLSEMNSHPAPRTPRRLAAPGLIPHSGGRAPCLALQLGLRCRRSYLHRAVLWITK